MGLVLWDYSIASDLELDGTITKQSPPMPLVLSPHEYSPNGVVYVHVDGSALVVTSCPGVGVPKFRQLDASFTTWTDIGTYDPDINGYFGFYGAVIIGNHIVTITQRGSDHTGPAPHFYAKYYIIGYQMDGDTIDWQYSFIYSASDESAPESVRADGRYLYWTAQGAYTWAFDCLAHDTDPVAIISLTDPAIYWERPNDVATDPRLDIDLDAAFPAADGYVYAWGVNDGFEHGSADRNQLFFYRVRPDSTGFSLLGELVDPDNANTTNYPSFSGTCVHSGGVLYILNDNLEPWISSFRVADAVFNGHAIAVPSVIDSPASINGWWSAPNLNGGIGPQSAYFSRGRV